MIENNFVASLRSDGAFGVALVFKPEGQYCMCSLSHGVVPHGASPLNHRSTGTLICQFVPRMLYATPFGFVT